MHLIRIGIPEDKVNQDYLTILNSIKNGEAIGISIFSTNEFDILNSYKGMAVINEHLKVVEYKDNIKLGCINSMENIFKIGGQISIMLWRLKYILTACVVTTGVSSVYLFTPGCPSAFDAITKSIEDVFDTVEIIDCDLVVFRLAEAISDGRPYVINNLGLTILNGKQVAFTPGVVNISTNLQKPYSKTPLLETVLKEYNGEQVSVAHLNMINEIELETVWINEFKDRLAEFTDIRKPLTFGFHPI